MNYGDMILNSKIKIRIKFRVPIISGGGLDQMKTVGRSYVTAENKDQSIK